MWGGSKDGKLGTSVSGAGMYAVLIGVVSMYMQYMVYDCVYYCDTCGGVKRTANWAPPSVAQVGMY
jgi:hypothetical protein